jgi:hypothetical protein
MTLRGLGVFILLQNSLDRNKLLILLIIIIKIIFLMIRNTQFLIRLNVQRFCSNVMISWYKHIASRKGLVMVRSSGKPGLLKLHSLSS